MGVIRWPGENNAGPRHVNANVVSGRLEAASANEEVFPPDPACMLDTAHRRTHAEHVLDIMAVASYEGTQVQT